MSYFDDNDFEQPGESPDDYQDPGAEAPPPAIEKIIALVFLLGAVCIIAFFNFDSFKYLFNLPKHAYKDFVYNHTREFKKEYRFKRALPGKYVDAGRDTLEIDPRAARISVYYVNNDKKTVTEYFQTSPIEDLEMTDDGFYKMPLVIPKETWQIVIDFTYSPKIGEVRQEYLDDIYPVGTNEKLIYFRDIIDGGRIVPDKAQYNYLRTLHAYDAKGKECSTFTAGDKIYIKVTDFSNMFPDGLDRTEFVADETFTLYSQNPAVVSKKPSKVTAEVVVFDAVGPGEAEFMYVDFSRILINMCKVKVKAKPKNK